MDDITSDIRRPLQRFTVAPSRVRDLGVAPGNALQSLLTDRHFAVDSERWLYDAAEKEDDDGHAVAGEAVRNYQVAAHFEAAIALIIGVEYKIRCNARVTVHSVDTFDFVADVLDRALLNEATVSEWE